MGTYGTREARKTLRQGYMTGYLRQAQWAEFTELKKVITEATERKKSPIDIFDIGVGIARVPVNLAEIEEMWNCIGKYVGIDIDGYCLRSANNNVRKHNLSNKVVIRRFDAWYLNDLLCTEQEYDIVLCTYFTAGNFPPSRRDDIKSAFQCVFRPAYDLLRPSGELVLGSIYKDNPSTAKRQRQFYEKCGMSVFSRPTDPFAAAENEKGKEVFWSLRFTEERIRDLFDWVDSEKIKFIPLDTYNFAIMVRIIKEDSKTLFHE